MFGNVIYCLYLCYRNNEKIVSVIIKAMIMEIREMLDLVKTNGSGTYKVTYKNGTSEKVRLFYRQGGDYLCEFKRGSSRYGLYFVLDDVASIELPVSKSENEIFRHTLKRLIKSLEESGLWADILQWAKWVDTLTDEELDAYKTRAFNTRSGREMETGFIGIDAFGRMFHKNAIKAVNYDKSWSFEEQVRQAIANKEDYHSPRWEKGYDNSVSVKKGEDGIVRGWYSEEYRGCGNGHYYLLIDAKHAIFCEND